MNFSSTFQTFTCRLSIWKQCSQPLILGKKEFNLEEGGGHLRKPAFSWGDVVGTSRSLVATIFNSRSEITEKESRKWCIVWKLVGFPQPTDSCVSAHLGMWRLHPRSGNSCGCPSPGCGTGPAPSHCPCSPHCPAGWAPCLVQSESCCPSPQPHRSPAAGTPRWRPPCPSRHRTLCPSCRCRAPPPCPHSGYGRSPVVLCRSEQKGLC